MSEDLIEYPLPALKRAGSTHEGVYDPAQGRETINSRSAGRLVRGTDGRLWNPRGAEGFQKTRVPHQRSCYSPVVKLAVSDAYVDLTADALVELATALKEGTDFVVADLEGWEIELIGCYQDSGGNLNLFVAWGPVGAEVTIDAKYTVATSTVQNLSQYRMSYPLYDPDNPTAVLSVKWSGAVGSGNGKVTYKLKKYSLVDSE